MKRIAALLVLAFVLAPQLASACTVCMGDPNSSTAQAANAAIFLMLGVLAIVFSMLGAFAYALYRRAQQPLPPHAELSAATPAPDLQ